MTTSSDVESRDGLIRNGLSRLHKSLHIVSRKTVYDGCYCKKSLI
jgi:hypothetical protein